MLRWVYGLVFAIGLASAADAQGELRIVTSYDADVVQPVLAGFAALHPEITVRVLNKNTHAAVDEILAGNDRRFDLFWASAPEAFEVLSEAGRLTARDAPGWSDFAWSALGWAWRDSSDEAIPESWNDLLASAYTGRIGMAHPMRSGTMQSLIETILQDRGWEAGWAWLLALSGQLNTISARSFGVLEGVERGDFALGLTIDFLAVTRAPRGINFRYGRPIILIPARIATLQGGENPKGAQSFTDFLLSKQGQRLLLHDDIRRIPVDPDLRAEFLKTAPPELEAALLFSWSRYDPKLAARRYWEVKQLFDIFAARDFLRRRELWRRLRAVVGIADFDRSRIERLLTWMPITEHQARSAPHDRETLLDWAERADSLLRLAEVHLDTLEAQP